MNALEHFRSVLKGCKFDVLTDHKPLKVFPKQYDLIGNLGRWQQILNQFDCTIEYLKGDKTVIADAFGRVFLNASILCSLSNFIHQAKDPLQHQQAPSSTFSLSSSSTVSPTAPTPLRIDSMPAITSTTTHTAIMMASAATTRSQAKGMTTIRNATPASHYKRSYDRALAAPTLTLTRFGNTLRATSEPPAGSSKTHHSTADPLIKLVVEDPHTYLPAGNTRPMRPHNPHHPASVAAAKLRSSHATMNFLVYPDTTGITYWYSHTNSRWRPKDRSSTYCNESDHITSSCALPRLDKQY